MEVIAEDAAGVVARAVEALDVEGSAGPVLAQAGAEQQLAGEVVGRRQQERAVADGLKPGVHGSASQGIRGPGPGAAPGWWWWARSWLPRRAGGGAGRARGPRLGPLAGSAVAPAHAAGGAGRRGAEALVHPQQAVLRVAKAGRPQDAP